MGGSGCPELPTLFGSTHGVFPKSWRDAAQLWQVTRISLWSTLALRRIVAPTVASEPRSGFLQGLCKPAGTCLRVPSRIGLVTQCPTLVSRPSETRQPRSSKTPLMPSPFPTFFRYAIKGMFAIGLTLLDNSATKPNRVWINGLTDPEFAL